MKKIVGIYLAAGQSTRMQESKLHLPAGNFTLGSIALKQALISRLDAAFIITRPGADIRWIDPAFYQSSWKNKWKTVEAERALEGQAYSLRRGIEEAEAAGAEAVIVMLADQPLITADIINQLISTCEEASKDYAAVKGGGNLQPPLLLRKQLFPRLKQLKGDKGARSLLRGDDSLQGSFISQRNDEFFYDIDTKEDYQWLLQTVSF